MGHLTTKYKACLHVGFNAFMKKFYIKSMMLAENLLFDVSFFMKMRTFYKKLPLFIKKNSILHLYKKTQNLNMSFYKNSNFGNNRDPWSMIIKNRKFDEILNSPPPPIENFALIYRKDGR